MIICGVPSFNRNAIFPVLTVQTGLRVWVDASYPQASGAWYANNTALSTIYDRSGNNATLVNGAGAQQPLFKLTSLNNLPGLDFAGNQFISFVTTLLSNGNSSYSIFVVCRATSNSPNRYLFFLGTASSNNALFIRYDSSQRMQSGWFANGILSNNNAWPINTHVILDTHYAGFERFQFVDGVSAGSGGNNLFNYMQNTSRLGFGMSSGSPFVGQIYEFLLYNRMLNDAEKYKVRSYLSVKWGIPVS